MGDLQVESSNLLSVVYRTGIPDIDDPAENYLEASKLYSSTVHHDLPGIVALDQSPELRTMSARAARRYASRLAVDLPEPAALDGTLDAALRARRSADGFGAGPLRLDLLSSLLRRTYGVTDRDGLPRRATPSGGALFPLDVFVVPRRVDGLRGNGLYHFDPFRSVLADLGDVDDEALHDCLVSPELSRQSAAVLLVTASFWRSRFKYGQRALRFALIESGHLAQNILLVATGHGLAARPLGGFLDNDLTALLPDHNGVDDAPLYALLVGPSPD
ncbi:SagB/ThcOx family dehydrogenase [Amycolatopsis suaedae]|uniref:SagB/ThcOx family dehydrogenase n=1 Tax=Amycolatopsis suaedae TaxID=2510978 RepID=A0A4Q7J5W9_9PSEU|nr:SagB/ThcOx family dehydrogenase [Amycolatopsis suaedae]RZQ62517.1 SagB/ThcOx family dehydrogenase [Amycolatopsis suaedae]